ncbi:MAG: flagellar FliJ family protein [Thermodesulfovibrionales bacterium]|nr:flagellar FliJ family protein [Thermodesulfovibrionales bacterium]
MPSTIENLLNLKTWTEDEVKSRFAIALRDLAIEEDILRGYEGKLNEIEEVFKNQKEGNVDLLKIEELLAHQNYLIKKIEEQRKTIIKKEEIAEKIRLELVEATREKRIFQRLLDKEREKMTKKLQRLEQINIDESASLKFNMSEE